MKHIPVLLQEVLDGLQIKPEGIYVDGTVGMGGHSYAIAKRLTSGRLIGIDRDRTALQESARRLQEFGDRVLLLHGNFTALKTILAEQQITKVDGILLDIGVSSPHRFDLPGRLIHYDGGDLRLQYTDLIVGEVVG
jgi:16S rRNA (cytosine1402-N4)-methyltransferase